MDFVHFWDKRVCKSSLRSRRSYLFGEQVDSTIDLHSLTHAHAHTHTRVYAPTRPGSTHTQDRPKEY